MTTKPNNQELTIIAGPCSVDHSNIDEIYAIAAITLPNSTKPAIAGTRVVGLKSRTEYEPSGNGMGIDAEAYQHNMLQILNGRQDQLITPPSVDIAHEVHTKTQMLIATEVMSPLIQLPHYRGRIPAGALMPWNPAVEQLGWPILATATIAAENDWYVGIKNGKWIGDHIHRANAKDYTGTTTMEKTWAGLTTYAQKVNKKTVLIHRGVDVPEKGDYRNAPVHTIAKRVKQKTGAKLYFDPSHAHGPKMKQQISYAIIDAMQLTLEDGSALYDGILVETGTSSTDTDQHISIDELRSLVSELARFRTIISRSPSS